MSIIDETWMILDKNDADVINTIHEQNSALNYEDFEKYWEEHSGNDKPKKCCVKDCGRKVTQYAPVRRSTFYNSVYILPICDNHKNLDDVIFIENEETAILINE